MSLISDAVMRRTARKRIKALYLEGDEVPENLKGTRSEEIIEDVRKDKTLGPSEKRVKPHGFFGAIFQSEKERGGVPNRAPAAAPVLPHVPHPMVSDETLAGAKNVREAAELMPLHATPEQIAKAEAAFKKREEAERRKAKLGKGGF